MSDITFIGIIGAMDSHFSIFWNFRIFLDFPFVNIMIHSKYLEETLKNLLEKFKKNI